VSPIVQLHSNSKMSITMTSISPTVVYLTYKVLPGQGTVYIKYKGKEYNVVVPPGTDVLKIMLTSQGPDLRNYLCHEDYDDLPTPSAPSATPPTPRTPSPFLSISTEAAMGMLGTPEPAPFKAAAQELPGTPGKRGAPFVTTRRTRSKTGTN